MTTNSVPAPFLPPVPSDVGPFMGPASPELFSRWYDLEEGFDNLVRPWVHSNGKRVFDLLLGSAGILVISPFCLLIAASIKATSRGPVLFRQQRMGKGNKAFTIYKLRTMKHEQGPNGLTVTRCADARTTRVGRVLRKLKMDELPQLYNIVRGDMTFVGPRPKLAQHERMDMHCRPGLTGAATLIFSHEEKLLAEIPEAACEEFTVRVLNRIKAEVDVEYAQCSTWCSDLAILYATFFGSKTRKPIKTVAELKERFVIDEHAEAILLEC